MIVNVCGKLLIECVLWLREDAIKNVIHMAHTLYAISAQRNTIKVSRNLRDDALIEQYVCGILKKRVLDNYSKRTG